jgi:hypothetical protein
VDAGVLIASLSLAVSCGGLIWQHRTWQAARKTDVRVVAWHDASGLDLFAETGVVDVEHVIALRVFNHGEQPEYITTMSLESATGERLVDDRPTAAKLVDDPPPTIREIPPRGQLAAQFKVSASATRDGFVGYVELGTGKRVYSVPAMVDAGLADIQSQILEAAEDASREEQE